MGKKPLALAVIMAIVATLLLPVALLAIAQPDSSPSLSNIKANRNLIEIDDRLIYGDYNIPYASPPSDFGADETYIFNLLNGDTLLGSITPFAMLDNGYNKGVFAFYFPASVNLTWGEAYTIRIIQNPIHFDAPETFDTIISSSAYTSATSQAINQSQLTINLISAAERLEAYYTNDTFLDTAVGGTVLSSPTGETYFRGVIYGVQAMAPSLFLVQTLDLYTTDREWTTEQFDTYGERFEGNWVGTAENATANQFGVSGSMIMGMLIILPLCVGFVIVSSMKFHRAEPGFLVSALLITMGALMGWISAAAFALVYQLSAIYLAYVWFYARG